MTTFNAQTQQACGHKCFRSVTLLRDNGHGERPQQLCIVTVIDIAESYNNDTICSLIELTTKSA